MPDLHEDTRQRHPDHVTSVEGARDVTRRAPNQRLQLLQVWGRHRIDGLTDEEAATEAGLSRSCFWKRCGELRAEGHLVEHPDEAKGYRKGAAGVRRKVWTITAHGLLELRAWGLHP